VGRYLKASSHMRRSARTFHDGHTLNWGKRHRQGLFHGVDRGITEADSPSHVPSDFNRYECRRLGFKFKGYADFPKNGKELEIRFSRVQVVVNRFDEYGMIRRKAPEAVRNRIYAFVKTMNRDLNFQASQFDEFEKTIENQLEFHENRLDAFLTILSSEFKGQHSSSSNIEV